MKAEKANENSWRILFSIANVFSYNEYFKEAIQMWQKTFDCMPKPRYTDSFEAMAQCRAVAITSAVDNIKENWNF